MNPAAPPVSVDPSRTRPLASAASVRRRDLVRGAPRDVRVLGIGRHLCILEVTPSACAVGDAGTSLLVTIVTADATALPDAIQLAVPSAATPFRRLEVGTTGRLGGGWLDLPGLRTAPARWWDPVPKLHARTPADLTVAAALAGAAVGGARHAAGPVPAPLLGHLDAVVAATARDDPDAVTAHALALLGAGEGSTPTGDDLLAGFVSAALAFAHASGDTSLADVVQRVGVVLTTLATDRTTALSAALLRAAGDGAVCLPVAAWLHALGGIGDLDTATERVLAIGSVSGRDLLTGAQRGVAFVAEHTTRPPAPPATPAPASVRSS